jgi:nucleoside-diphosphate-sugar epimerase
MQELGWQPRIQLRDGLANAYRWFREHRTDPVTSA